MQKFITSILFLSASTAAAGQVYHPYIHHLFSAKTTASSTDAFNASFNPSLLPFINSIEAASYAEKKYLTDIHILVISVCAPFYGNGVSFTLQRFGNRIFNESTFGLGYGKKFGEVNAGIYFQHIRVKIKDAENVSLVKAGISSSMKLTDKVYAGCRISNPNLFAKKSPAKLRAASSFALSLGWEASSQVYAGIESLKEEDQPLSLMFSLHYRFAEKFNCTLVWDTYSNQPFAALGWQQEQFMVEAGCSYHASLGASPAISFLFRKRSGQ